MAFGLEQVEVLIDNIKTDVADLRITRTINQHSEIFISALFKVSEAKYLEMMGTKTPIAVNVLKRDNSAKIIKRESLFRGIVNQIKVRVTNGIAHLDVYGLSYSCELDRYQQTRTFQDPAMTYVDLIKAVVGDQATFKFSNENNPHTKIARLTVQYRETAFTFIKRMASRFRDPIVVDDTEAKPWFWFGLNKGQNPQGTLEDKLYTVTKATAGYYEYCNAARRYNFQYDEQKEQVKEGDYVRYHLKNETESYAIGDLFTCNKRKLYVYRRVLKTVGGLIRYDYDLASEFGLKQKRLVNPQLAGASLTGKVIGVEKDHVKVQFAFDPAIAEAKAWPFPFATFYSAENNTGWYCMPETGEKVRVFFPLANEEKAFVTNVIHQGSKQNYQRRFFATSYGQQMVFEPAGMEFRTQHGKEEKNGAVLGVRLDQNIGVSVFSEKDIQLASSGNLDLHSENRLVLNATKEIQLKCKASSLKIDAQVWRYGTNIYDDTTEPGAEKSEGGKGGGTSRLSPKSGQIPAPAIGISKSDNNEDNSNNKTDEQKKYYLGADGKKHYLEPALLYQCQLNAYNNSAFNKSGTTTYCNRFAESVLQQYTGSKEWIGKSGNAILCIDIYTQISKSAKWKNCNPVEAETKAREGYFVFGITTSAMNSKLPEHIAVICPKGNGVRRGGVYCPSIAQQGSSKILYGKSDGYTANYGWDKTLLGYIKYYYKIPDSKLK